MKYQYETEGTCSRQIDIEIEDDVIKSVSFDGGCHGNLQGIAALVKGKRPEEIIPVLEGIKCRTKPTSCPDQLARALREALKQ